MAHLRKVRVELPSVDQALMISMPADFDSLLDLAIVSTSELRELQLAALQS